MYIETRFYDNGKAEALLVDCIDKHSTEEYDRYYDKLSDDKHAIFSWVNEMCIDGDDVDEIYAALVDGKLVDITNFC